MSYAAYSPTGMLHSQTEKHIAYDGRKMAQQTGWPARVLALHTFACSLAATPITDTLPGDTQLSCNFFIRLAFTISLIEQAPLFAGGMFTHDTPPDLERITS